MTLRRGGCEENGTEPKPQKVKPKPRTELRAIQPRNNGLELEQRTSTYSKQARVLGEQARQKVGVYGPLGGEVSTVTFFLTD